MDNQQTIVKNIKRKFYKDNWRINAKLDEKQVRKIKKKYERLLNKYKPEIYDKIAKEYDVKPTTIKKIIAGKSWKWVK